MTNGIVTIPGRLLGVIPATFPWKSCGFQQNRFHENTQPQTLHLVRCLPDDIQVPNNWKLSDFLSIGTWLKPKSENYYCLFCYKVNIIYILFLK